VAANRYHLCGAVKSTLSGLVPPVIVAVAVLLIFTVNTLVPAFQLIFVSECIVVDPFTNGACKLYPG
jgi:hypothetical protein